MQNGPMGTPAIYVTVAPKDAMDQEKMSNVLTKLMREYPSVKMEIDRETNQTIFPERKKCFLRSFSID
jgi:translation elongation factor EF-G